MAAPVGAIVEIALKSTLCGQTCLTILHYAVQTVSTIPLTLDEQDQILLDISGVGAGTLRSVYSSVLPGNSTLVGMRAQFVSPIRFRVSSNTLAVPGGRDIADAANQATVLTKRTQLAGRREIGSVHLPSGGAGDLEEGVLSAAYKLALSDLEQELEENIVASVGGGVYAPVIAHRGPLPWTSSFVTDVTIQETARVMRRRTVGLGI